MIYDPLLNLISKNNNWQEILKAEPKFITVKQCPWKNDNGSLKYPELYMLSYDGIYSDFNDEVVRLCRGCIISLEEPLNPTMICEPFVKFGNYGQEFCPNIDWDSALVEQKVDGILIKLFFYKNEWHWVTNNGWDTSIETSFITKLPSKYKEIETDNFTTVQDLIEYSLCNINFNLKTCALNPAFTYMFELISPKLRILVDNPKTKLIYLGCRNNYTSLELTLEQAYTINPNLKMFDTVKYFDLHNIDEVLALCNTYKGDENEGVVVVDKYFNRVKIKCENYILLKGYRNAFDTTDEKIFKGIKENTIDDAIGAFPEIQNTVNKIKNDLIAYKSFLISITNKGKEHLEVLKQKVNSDLVRKEYANWVKALNTPYAFAYFEALKENPNFENHLNKIQYKDIKKALNKE